MRLFGTHSDPETAPIADRLRTLLADHRAESVAEQFGLSAGALQSLIDNRERTIDVVLLLDLVAVLVHEWAIDPSWLLTGEYDTALHRDALLLGEDRSTRGRGAVRELIESEYRRLSGPRVLSLPSFRDIIRRRAAG